MPTHGAGDASGREEKPEQNVIKCVTCKSAHGTLVKVAKGVYRCAHHFTIRTSGPPPRPKGTQERKPPKVPVTRHPETFGVRRHG